MTDHTKGACAEGLSNLRLPGLVKELKMDYT